MYKILVLTLTLLTMGTPAVWAQTQVTASAPRGNVHITGTVIDSTTKEPVPFATVALINPATKKPVDGAVCDDKGKFTLAKVSEGSFALQISFIGYNTVEIKLPTITDKSSDVNMGQIYLSSQTQKLQEVEIVGQRNLIEEKVDRTVYNAENDATAKGGDATDVLRRVPMLSVDMDGNVSMRGSQNIRVLINNKPSTITAGSIADALKQIPADQIKSVEVITSPSAKYDAEGSGGIINIITKKNNMQGISLNIDGSAGLRGANLGLNGSYRKGKMGFSLGGFGRGNYNVNGKYENSQRTGPDTSWVLNTQRANTRNNGLFGRYTLGWDYDINKYNSLSASVQYGVRNNTSYQDDLTTLTYRNTMANPTASNVSDAKIKDQSGTVDLNLTYTRLFDKPQKELSILALYSRNNRNNDFLSLSQTAATSSQKNINDSYNQEVTLQLDYQNPIAKNQMLEMGAKNIMRKVTSDYQTFTALEDGTFLLKTDTAYSNNLTYNQNVTSGYASYTFSTQNNYSFKVGGRYEYTTINAYLKDENDIDIPSYGVLVPSLNISKKLKKGNMVKFSYNRRIQRPSIQFLNPNAQPTNPLNITEGNPKLQPEYTNNFEVGYNTTIKTTSLNFAAFARNTNDAIQSVRDTFTLVNSQTGERNQGVRTNYQNIGSENSYGVNLFVNINLSNKLSLNGGADVFYSMLNNNNPNPIYRASNEGWVYNFRFFGNYTIKNGWGIQAFSFYRGRQVQLQGIQGGFGIYSLGIRKEFKNKKGSIGFGAENFFTTAMRIRTELNSPILTQRSVNEMHNMNFKITFSYRIGKMSFDSAPKRRKSINNDDMKEGGDNGGGMGGGEGQGQGGRQQMQGQGRPPGQGAPQQGGQRPGGQYPGQKDGVKRDSTQFKRDSFKKDSTIKDSSGSILPFKNQLHSEILEGQPANKPAPEQNAKRIQDKEIIAPTKKDS
ncbi:TonB-dependent receptor [Cytophagaceae bacterium YF14B1]|uniref:TonB-dependent receptor n=1 Tax=Xanthocytophaga flava TaxID=3048013 RepID=A0AAE3QMN5_9BACT|nr:TonB-dependent receptor [Xanthocytophaga flavus]MDJ1479741.1 TonB-dependent receptor [Xanthocytophaga flavus]